VWAFNLAGDVSASDWTAGFRFSINRICYRGNSCVDGSSAGIWSLTFVDDVSISDWAHGLRLK